MIQIPPELLDLFERQHGVASKAQLTDHGVSPHTLRVMQRAGLIRLVLHGAYRLRGVEESELGRCVAVCTAHPRHAIAGPTAGRIWGFRRLPADRRIHTLSPPGSQPTRATWVVPYRTAAVHPSDFVRRLDGIAVTSRPRTALDLARFLAPRDLLSVIEQAMSDGGHTLDEMRRVAADWMSPQRRWVRVFLEQIDRRVAGGPAESHPEVELGAALEAVGVRGLVRQHRIDLPGYGPARFDLAVPDIRWAVEVDAFPTHRETTGLESDASRDRAAHELGWLVSRVGPSGLGPSMSSTVDHLRSIHDQRRRDLASTVKR